MIWNGYTPYDTFMKRLTQTQPAVADVIKHEPQTFRPMHALEPYTNTPMQASSTFVRNIRYVPNTNTAFVKLGGRQYWYNMSPKMLSNWLTSNSLGSFYNKHIKL